jgi:hypothetical protein
MSRILGILLLSIPQFVFAEALYFACETNGGIDNSPYNFTISLDMENQTMELDGDIFSDIVVSPTMVIATNVDVSSVGVFATTYQLSREDLSLVQELKHDGTRMGLWTGSCVLSEEEAPKVLF